MKVTGEFFSSGKANELLKNVNTVICDGVTYTVKKFKQKFALQLEWEANIPVANTKLSDVASKYKPVKKTDINSKKEDDSKTKGDSDAEKPNLDKVGDNYLKKKGVDAHQLKKDVYGKKAKVAEYDIYVDKNTGQLYTQRKPQYNKRGELPIATGEYIK